jgi:hypothetical protein
MARDINRGRMNISLFARLIFSATLFAGLLSTAFAAEFHFAPGGLDNNAGEHVAQASVYPKLPFFDFVSWQKLGFNLHSIAVQPQFRDSAHGDFHPAVKAPQAGLDPALAEMPLDFDGRPRTWPVTAAGPFEAAP